MPKEIDWKLSDADRPKVDAIVKRALGMKMMTKRNAINVEMSLIACHLNDTRLDLDKLLAADDFNFGHDVAGIDQHTSRSTGRLTGHFRPRCAARLEAKA